MRHPIKTSFSRIALGAALVATAGLISVPVSAQQEAQGSGADLGAHLGWAKSHDADDGNFLFGGHLELRPVPRFGIHGAIDYRLADTIEAPGEGELNIRSVPVTVSGRGYLIASPQFELFLTAGVGWYYVLYDYSDELEDLGLEDTNVSTFGWHLGGGFAIPINSGVDLYAELRAIYVDPDQDLDDEVIGLVEDGDYDSLYAAVGLNFEI